MRFEASNVFWRLQSSLVRFDYPKQACLHLLKSAMNICTPACVYTSTFFLTLNPKKKTNVGYFLLPTLLLKAAPSDTHPYHAATTTSTADLWKTILSPKFQHAQVEMRAIVTTLALRWTKGSSLKSRKCPFWITRKHLLSTPIAGFQIFHRFF